MRFLYFISICIIVLIVVHSNFNTSENYTTSGRQDEEPIIHDTLKTDTGMCSSNRQNNRSCDMHTFHQHAHFKQPLHISGDIYVCKPSPPCDENNIYRWILGKQQWNNNFNTLNDVISKGLKTGLSTTIAKNLMKGGRRKNRTLMERLAVLKQKQKTTKQVLIANEQEINQIKYEVTKSGYDLWKDKCYQTIYAGNYGFQKEPKYLDNRQKVCYDTFWLW